jgi:hypothetical protein
VVAFLAQTLGNGRAHATEVDVTDVMDMICRVVAAPVAEPVDAADSKSVVRKDVPVRVGPGAP